MFVVTFSFMPAARAAENARPERSPGLFGAPVAGPAPERLRFLDTAWGLLVLVMVFAGATAALSGGSIEPSWPARVSRFAAAFGAPAFFMLAGLLLKGALEATWPAYLSRNVAPLAWRAALFTIVGALLVAGLGGYDISPLLRPRALAEALVDPPTMILLIEQLALCLLFMRLTRGLRAALVLPVLMALEIAQPDLGGPLFSGACRLLVYLYVGHIFAPEIRQLAKFVGRDHKAAGIGLVTWAAINIVATSVSLPLAGGPTMASLPFASLGLGLFGATAAIALAALIDSLADPALLRWIGARALGAWFGYFLMIEAWRALEPRMPARASLAILLLAIASGVVLAIGMARRARAA